MRRNDRELTNMDDILEILKKCDVCRLAFFDEEYPYIIPLNFGFSYEGTELIFYFHGANVGKKIDLIKQNPKVSFELDCSHHLITGEKACDYTMEYESICGNGIAMVLSEDEKVNALTYLMKQYAKDTTFEFNENHLKAVTVFQVKATNLTAKRLKRS
ncbi:MAG: pyridoxamine 5-phosphate oxidase-related FMN-binding protein [Herbinix sp.]|jgi:nitroimidazol reductase NimA-like FMN-containing flavoprotein (pyridoxamine 5'-phosphate oxidase superfamily)|nr:pyridoxamine 5-phosphate oxidase-related FMN-binding protein [Herbinix sp.]